MVLPTTATGLYWSIRGEVACSHHASRISDDRWQSEGWTSLPASSQGFRGLQFQCQHCAPGHTPLVHRAVTGTPWSDIADAARAKSTWQSPPFGADPPEPSDDAA